MARAGSLYLKKFAAMTRDRTGKCGVKKKNARARAGSLQKRERKNITHVTYGKGGIVASQKICSHDQR
jgi:hypothetical protein